MSDETVNTNDIFDDFYDEIKKQKENYDLFTWYSPVNTFLKPNKYMTFLDRKENPIEKHSGDFLRDDSLDLDPGLKLYYEKGKKCFDSLISLLTEVNSELDLNTFTDNDFLGAYAETLAMIYLVAQTIDDSAREVINKTTNRNIKLMPHLRGLPFLSQKYAIILQLDFPDIIFEKYHDFIYLYSTLEILDDILLCEITSESADGYYNPWITTAEFHNCYYEVIERRELLLEAKLSQTKSAVDAKMKKTKLRDSYVIELWEQQGKPPPKEFAFDRETVSLVNEYSKRIGKTSLTPTGAVDTIYRMILSHKKNINK